MAAPTGPHAREAGAFGRALRRECGKIERQFGHWASTPELNPDLPSWVRGIRRVRRWVQCKIITIMIDRLLRTQPALLPAP